MIIFLSFMVVITFIAPFILWSAFNFKPDFFRHWRKWRTILITWGISWAICGTCIGLMFLFI